MYLILLGFLSNRFLHFFGFNHMCTDTEESGSGKDIDTKGHKDFIESGKNRFTTFLGGTRFAGFLRTEKFTEEDKNHCSRESFPTIGGESSSERRESGIDHTTFLLGF